MRHAGTIWAEVNCLTVTSRKCWLKGWLGVRMNQGWLVNWWLGDREYRLQRKHGPQLEKDGKFIFNQHGELETNGIAVLLSWSPWWQASISVDMATWLTDRYTCTAQRWQQVGISTAGFLPVHTVSGLCAQNEWMHNLYNTSNLPTMSSFKMYHICIQISSNNIFESLVADK